MQTESWEELKQHLQIQGWRLRSWNELYKLMKTPHTEIELNIERSSKKNVESSHTKENTLKRFKRTISFMYIWSSYYEPRLYFILIWIFVNEKNLSQLITRTDKCQMTLKNSEPTPTNAIIKNKLNCVKAVKSSLISFLIKCFMFVLLKSHLIWINAREYQNSGYLRGNWVLNILDPLKDI